MVNRLSRAAVVGFAALAMAGLTTVPANAATVTFDVQCESGGLRIVCTAWNFSGGTAPYKVTWSSRGIWTLINSTTGSGNCYRGHPYSVQATATDAKGATGIRVTGGGCNAGPWP
jgi:hypothetical protein